MKHVLSLRAGETRAIASIAALLAATAVANAGGSLTTPSVDYIKSDDVSVISSRAASYFAGFETAEGYAVGPIEPQQGWSASGTNLPAFSVSTANPFAGTQHLRVVNDTTVGAGSQRVILGANLGAQVPTAQTASVQVAISNDQGADIDVIGQAPSQAFTTWRVKFHFDDGAGGAGQILILDDPAGAPALGFYGTGVTWAEGPYRELKVVSDPVAGSITYSYNNAVIYTGAYFGGTVVEQLGVLSDNFQLAGETADFDNFSLNDVPEPASLGLIGLTGLGLLSRRRQQA